MGKNRKESMMCRASPNSNLKNAHWLVKGAGGPDEEDNRWPPWLKPLWQENFFVQCKLHADSHKSECNMYCLDCVNGPLCSVCLAFHKEHRAIQAKNYDPEGEYAAYWWLPELQSLPKDKRNFPGYSYLRTVVPLKYGNSNKNGGKSKASCSRMN